MEEIIYKIIAILGLVLIIFGTLMISAKKKRLKKRYIYPLLVAGGICLEIYSIYIQDLIFIILQAVFIIVAIYGISKYHEHKHKK